jgi:hypothetical protein
MGKDDEFKSYSNPTEILNTTRNRQLLFVISITF